MTTIAKEKVLLFWSGGKDSALALHALQSSGQYEVLGLVTVFNRENNHVKYHGLPDKIVIEQAKLLGLPLQRIFVAPNATNDEYAQELKRVLSMFVKKGIKHIAFGDINLKDVREFKETMAKELDMTALFPLWGQETKELALKFCHSGFKAIITSVNTEMLSSDYLAREFNEDYLNKLPQNIDPAGENGEFHTFVIFGPGFKMRVPFSKAIAIEEGPYLVTLIKEP